MNLPMQFRYYRWRNNPYEITIQYTRIVQEQHQPCYASVIQNLGKQSRIITGKGVFLGSDCQEQFDELASQLEQGGEGLLILPGKAPMRAVFVSLKLIGETRPGQISYSFQFQEVPTKKADGDIKYYLVRKEGETLWHVAAQCGVTVDVLRIQNQVQWPNALPIGLRLVLP